MYALISLCALLPDCANLYIDIYIYRYIYMREIYSVLLMMFFCSTAGLSYFPNYELLSVNYCNGLGQ